MGQSFLDEKRGLVKQLFTFYTQPTVPTIRITMKGNQPVLELGKRARIRENSLCDGIDRKGWDIEGSPVPMIQGKQMEMGYILHPCGATVEFKPNIKVIAADTNGNPIQEGETVYDADNNPTEKKYEKTKYVDLNFEGVIGVDSDLDDFNESTEQERSRGWIVPFFVGTVAGVFFFAPMFAWFIAWVGQRAAGA